jgi:hypothetical protein
LIDRSLVEGRSPPGQEVINEMGKRVEDPRLEGSLDDLEMFPEGGATNCFHKFENHRGDPVVLWVLKEQSRVLDDVVQEAGDMFKGLQVANLGLCSQSSGSQLRPFTPERLGKRLVQF